MVVDIKPTTKQKRSRVGSVDRTDLLQPGDAALLNGDTTARALSIIRAVQSPAPRAVGHSGFDMEILMVGGQNILHYTDFEGAERYKFVSSASLKAAFGGEPTDSGWLPQGVVRWGQTIEGEFVAYAMPPKQHNILVEFDVAQDEGEEEEGPHEPGGEGDEPELVVRKPTAQVLEMKVPLPGLLFVGCADRWYLWAYAGKELTSSSPLFMPPVPNIYENGGICWGSNKPPAPSAANVPKAWELFLSSPFNDHIAGRRSLKYPNDVRVQLAALSADGVRKYPVSDLVSAGHRNADQMLDRVLGKEGRGW